MIGTPSQRQIIQVGMMFILGLAGTPILAADLPQNQQQQRVAPGAPVYSLDPAASRHNAAPHQTGVFNDETIQSAGLTRHYRMVVPDSYDAGRPIGVLFGFQGAGNPRASFLWSTGFEDLAAEAGWITVALAAKDDGGWDCANFDETSNADLRGVHDILTRLRQLYAIDEDRLYATGFAEGANFCQMLAVTWPTLWAAINPNLGTIELAPRAGARFSAILASGLLDAEGRSVEHNRLLYGKLRAQGLEVECHEFGITAQWPPADDATNPARPWTRAVAEYFLKHPRHPPPESPRAAAPPACPAPLQQSGFRDDFRLAGQFGKAWHLERFDEQGIFFPLSGCDIRPAGGVLRAHTCDEGHHGLFCFSGFVPRPVTWSIGFTIETPGTDMELYPAVLRDMSGRVLALCLSTEGWKWQLADSQTAFRAHDDAHFRTLARGPLTLTPGQACQLVLHDDATPNWILYGPARAILAQGNMPDGPAHPGEPRMGDAEFGLGLRGRHSVVFFDHAELTQTPLADNPALLDRALVDYFTAWSPF